MHANSPQAVPARLIAMGALAGLAPETVTIQAAAALHAVLHVERRPAPRGETSVARMPVALSTVTYREGRLELVPVMHTEGDQAVRGPGYQELMG